jgi:SPP1 family predicted phage head-tail adaptor
MTTKNKAARMRYRVDIQHPIETLDVGGEPLVTWQNFASREPAEYTPTGGIEFMRGRQLEANTKAVFRIRYRDGYSTQMRVVFQGKNFGITYVNPVDGMRRFIELFVSEGAAA